MFHDSGLEGEHGQYSGGRVDKKEEQHHQLNSGQEVSGLSRP